MAKILQVHNEYLIRGGEDTVVESEYELLKSRGHEVKQFIVRNRDVDTSSGWGKAQLFGSSIWGSNYKSDLLNVLSEFKPEVAHVHNFFPLLSPTIFPHLRRSGCRVVVTLHNYRLACSGATLLRDGNICTLCLSGSKLNAIRHGCYRGSRVGSAAIVLGSSLHLMLRSLDSVDTFIVLSKFASGIFSAKGIPEFKHKIKPNFVNAAQPELLGRLRKNQILFAGRFSVEKGVDRLLQAWEDVKPDGWTLLLVGDGPLKPDLLERFGGLPGVEWLGHLPHGDVLSLASESRWVIISSRCFEMNPMIALEAMSVGTPLIVPDLGSLPLFVENGSGLVFEDCPDGLARTLAAAMRMSASEWEALSDQALYTASTDHSPEQAYVKLMEAYGL